MIKPLAQAFIGRTCIAHYPRDDSNDPRRKRYYPITRSYFVNLLGIKLEIKSLAFQEQDKVVSACATSAIWSALQGTGSLFHHRIPSPSEITIASSEDLSSDKRAIPSSGLRTQQIARGIQAQGLETDLIRPDSYKQLCSIVYSYNRCGIPVLGLLPMVDIIPSEVRTLPSGVKSYQANWRGYHAICFVGYSLFDNDYIKDNKYTDICLRGYAANRLYAHDDQVGPFSRLIVDGHMVKYLSPSGTVREEDSFGCMWANEFGKHTGVTRFALGLLMIPLRTIIRISHSEILELMSNINECLQLLRVAAYDHCHDVTSMKWDIHLTTSNKYKQAVRKSRIISNVSKMRLLETHLPKYIWSALVVNADNEPIMSLVFDATDSHLGNYLVITLCFKTRCCNRMMELVRQDAMMKQLLAMKKGDIQTIEILKSMMDKCVFC